MTLRLFDAHCDTAYEIWDRNESLKENSCHISLKRAEKIDAYAQIFAFCSLAGLHLHCAHGELLSGPMKKLRNEVRENAGRIAFAKSAEDISQCNAAGKIAALLSLEGPELIDCDPEKLNDLWEQGFVMSTLTWNADNSLAGCHTGQKGLSDRGRAFVREAQRLGIYVDVSHLSERSFWDLVEITEKPILASHSNCRSICNHSRNLSDDQLRFIAQSGGVVGLNLYVPFLGEGADFGTLQKHLEHMLRLCGEKHVCLGGDLDGCDILPRGFAAVDDYASFYTYLKSEGYDEKLLDDLFYGNLLRLF